MKDVESTGSAAKLANRIQRSLSGHYRYRTAEEGALLGVKRQVIDGDLPRTERETSLNFVDADNYASVDTARPQWQRRLERDGAVPLVIITFGRGEGECRLYHIPRRWVKLPYDAAKKGADEVDDEAA